MNRWILKTDSDVYPYDQLERERHAVWDGVSNPVALKHMRSMAPGDSLLIYHSGATKEIVGLARVTRAAYPDPKSDDPSWLWSTSKPIANSPTGFLWPPSKPIPPSQTSLSSGSPGYRSFRCLSRPGKSCWPWRVFSSYPKKPRQDIFT